MLLVRRALSPAALHPEIDRRLQLMEEAKEVEYYRIPQEKYKKMASSQHYAVLELFELTDFVPTLDSIAKRLKYSKAGTEQLLQDLIFADMVRAEGDRFVKLHQNYTTQLVWNDEQKRVLNESHKTSLEEAIAAIDAQALGDRDYSQMTFAIDSSKIPEAKKMIREFRRELSRFLESGTRDRLYRINIQFFRMDQD